MTLYLTIWLVANKINLQKSLSEPKCLHNTKYTYKMLHNIISNYNNFWQSICNKFQNRENIILWKKHTKHWYLVCLWWCSTRSSVRFSVTCLWKEYSLGEHISFVQSKWKKNQKKYSEDINHKQKGILQALAWNRKHLLKIINDFVVFLFSSVAYIAGIFSFVYLIEESSNLI